MEMLRFTYDCRRGYMMPSSEEIRPLVEIAYHLISQGFIFCRAFTSGGISEITHSGDAPYNASYSDLDTFRRCFVDDFFATQKSKRENSGGWISSLNYGNVDVCLRKDSLLFRASTGGGFYIEWLGYADQDQALIERTNEVMQQILQTCSRVDRRVYTPRKVFFKDWGLTSMPMPKMEGYWVFAEAAEAVADPGMDNKTVKKLWNSFSLTQSHLTVQPGMRNTFRIGSTALPALADGKEYALRVDENGVAIVGRDHGGLMRGFLSMLMKIECGEAPFRIKAVTEESSYCIRNRMIHICVFPENDLYYIKKLIRLAGLCQYTHIVIEFWGMLQYDCLKELAWPQAFTKAQAKELIQECRELGMEPIPMFNQLGHATASRLCYGKHVVLDQNPRLQRLFTPDGWAWNIHSQEVFALLKQVRQELYELFGQGEYIHVGCDEAYYYTRCDEERKKMPAFLKALTDEVVAEGRRPMVWMDMLLERDKYNQKVKAYASCAPDEVEQLQGALNPATVMVDWQYNMTEAPIEPLLSLKDNIRDAMGAPWYKKDNYTAYVDTIVEHGMFGIMLTTWHTLQKYMYSILGCAKKCGAKTFDWSDNSGLREETATLLRRVSFEGNTYADCGWSKEQIEV